MLDFALTTGEPAILLPTDEVRLETSEGTIVTTTVAVIGQSALLHNMLCSMLPAAKGLAIPLPNVSEAALARVLEWLRAHIADDGYTAPHEYQSRTEIMESLRNATISERDEALFEKLSDEQIIDLALAADYLQIQPLVNLQKLRDRFGLPDDLSEERKAEIRARFGLLDPVASSCSPPDAAVKFFDFDLIASYRARAHAHAQTQAHDDCAEFADSDSSCYSGGTLSLDESVEDGSACASASEGDEYDGSEGDECASESEGGEYDEWEGGECDDDAEGGECDDDVEGGE
ncbi:hypothetical protein H9P43_002967 [Blastocladiella emersonii ATCC 22665]|nr:hypothetical protein H9P43_002962 [Blastocladiella emersonii ATCC 22665]KAI9183915.1 hypothetical protein H9P43_002967 [Blastocladiella emersonii ATCC 22665]